MQSDDGSFKEPIDDLECIYIYIRQKELKKNPNASKKILLPDMILDIGNMTAVLNDHPDDKLKLIRSEVNDRQRFTKSKKANGD